MGISSDGIKPNGVAPSVCSVWYSLLAMIRLLRCSCAPAIYDTSNHVCAGPFGRTAPIRHVETHRSTGRSHRPTCQGPEGSHERFAEPTARRTSTHPFRSSLDRKIFRYSPSRPLGLPLLIAALPSEMAQRTGRTLARLLGLRFRPDHERLIRITRVGIMPAHGERGQNWLCQGLCRSASQRRT